MAVVETVRIVCPRNPGRAWRINRADFDPARHQPWPELQAEPDCPPEAEHGCESRDELQRMSRAGLLELARNMGLRPDGRLGVERLRQVILAHQQLHTR